MPQFTPPSRVKVPPVTPDTPKYQQRPFGYFKAYIERDVNVWIYTDNTISELQPPLWIPRKNYDSQGNLLSVTPGVQKVFYGGRTYEITENEKEILTQAGYGSNITG